MGKSIKQLADELGISKQALNKRIDKLGCRNQLLKNGNQWLIPESIENAIKEAFSTTNQTTTKEQSVDKMVDTILKQLEEKDRQIKEKDEQIKKLQQLLDQEQQLCAANHQKILMLEEKSKKPFWKIWFNKGEIQG